MGWKSSFFFDIISLIGLYDIQVEMSSRYIDIKVGIHACLHHQAMNFSKGAILLYSPPWQSG